MDKQKWIDTDGWTDKQMQRTTDRQTIGKQRWMDRLTDGQTTDEWTNRDG